MEYRLLHNFVFIHYSKMYIVWIYVVNISTYIHMFKSQMAAMIFL